MWAKFIAFVLVRVKDWWSAVAVKLLAGSLATWALYGVLAAVRDEWASQYWQDRLTLGVLLPGVPFRIWTEVALLILFVVSVEGIHRVSQRARDEQAKMAAFRRSRPQPVVRLDDTGEVIYLEVSNAGYSGYFQSQLTLTGTKSDPPYHVFAKWDHDMSGGAVTEIHHGLFQRLRLARRIHDGQKMRYEVFWGEKANKNQQPLPSANASLADTATHDWRVKMALVITTDPDHVDGPLPVTVMLNGDGSSEVV